MLVELEDELGVKVEEDVDPFDKFFQDLEGPLRLDDGGFAKSLLEVVDYLYVPLFGLLEGLGLSRFHYVTPRIYIHPFDYFLNYVRKSYPPRLRHHHGHGQRHEHDDDRTTSRCSLPHVPRCLRY